MGDTIKLKRGTASEWDSANPVLSLGEPGLEVDTNYIKFGDGVTAWDSLPYFKSAATRLLTDGYNLGANAANGDLFVYEGSADITVNLGTPSGMQAFSVVNLGTGKITFSGSFENSTKMVLAGGNALQVKIITAGTGWWVSNDTKDNLTTGALTTVDEVTVSVIQTNEVAVSFPEPVTIEDTKGFFLIGPYRITGFRNSGSQTIFLQLSDHIIPETDFTLTYRREYGSVRTVSGGDKVASFTGQAVNGLEDIASYNGTRTIHRVNPAGGADYTTVSAAYTAASPGDYILLARGQTYGGGVKQQWLDDAGDENNYYTIAPYGTGADPVFEGVAGEEVIQVNGDYYHIYGINIPEAGGAGTTTADFGYGIRLDNRSAGCILVGCNVSITASKVTGGDFGIRMENIDAQVIACTVHNFAESIIATPQNGGANPGGIFLNTVTVDASNSVHSDCIRMINDTPSFNGFTCAFNECSGYGQDGIDQYGADDIVTEYNYVHSPQAGASNGIKIGGDGQTGGSAGNSLNNIARYNRVDGALAFGITTNGADYSKIYGNLITNSNAGVGITDYSVGSEVFNNTIINITNNAVFISPNASGTIRVFNNILEGGTGISAGVATVGSHNIFLSGGTVGSYTSEGNDSISTTKTALFVDQAAGDYRLKVGSPAINAGKNVAFYTSDLEGNDVDDGTMDIGAYEYQG